MEMVVPSMSPKNIESVTDSIIFANRYRNYCQKAGVSFVIPVLSLSNQPKIPGSLIKLLD